MTPKSRATTVAKQQARSGRVSSKQLDATIERALTWEEREAAEQASKVALGKAVFTAINAANDYQWRYVSYGNTLLWLLLATPACGYYAYLVIAGYVGGYHDDLSWLLFPAGIWLCILAVFVAVRVYIPSPDEY